MLPNGFCWLLIEPRFARTTDADRESKQLIYTIIRMKIKRKISTCFVINQSKIQKDYKLLATAYNECDASSNQPCYAASKPHYMQAIPVE